MIAHKAFNVRLWLAALLLAFAAVLFHDPINGIWTTGDHDVSGLYPAQDCGPHHGFILHVGDEPICVTRLIGAETVASEAIERLKAEGHGIFKSGEEGVRLLSEKIWEVLEEIQSSIFMPFP